MDLPISAFIIVAYYVLVMVIFFKVLLENKNPLKTQSYLLLLVLLPVFGLVIYLFFGVNFRKQKLFSRKGITDNKVIQQWGQVYSERLHYSKEYLKEALGNKSKLLFLFWRNSGAPVTLQNQVKILNNGEEKFPELLKQLQSAQNHIHIEYYIFEEGEIWNRIMDILCAKARQGVEVRLIYDSLGSNNLKNSSLRRLKKASVECGAYNPVIFPTLANRVNYRDHRKIVVVDGKTGFTGGINISDRYINNSKSDLYWRDTHCMIKGNAVYSLQIQFLLNWRFVSKKLLPISEKYFPPIPKIEGVPTAVLGSQPDSDFAHIMEAYFQMIHAAENEVLITTPYFIPNGSILTALKVTAKSGVAVKLLLPGKSDTFFVQAAGFSYVEDLLENDIEVYLYEKGMIHSKVMIIDGEFCSVGTANFDYRSFDNNAEVNAFFFDNKVGEKLRNDFYRDLRYSQKIKLESWHNRPLGVKLVGSIGRLVAPLL